MPLGIETRKQTENLLILKAIISKACKKWPRNGKSQVLKNVTIGFWKVLIFVIINIWKICWHQLCNCSNWSIIFFTSTFILQVVNILVLLFWTLCVLDKLEHCFLNLKGHLKIVKNYKRYCSWYQWYYKWHYYHYFHIVHYRWINWITWTCIHYIFSFPFDSKSSYGKTKTTPINLSPVRTQRHAHNCS